jgi:hypothetical protein
VLGSILRNPLAPATLALAVVASALAFGVVAFFTRATPRRMAGALVGALPVVPLVMFYDRVAGRLGWWHYPVVTTGSAPLAWYVTAALVYGAAMGLVGWRVIRRHGTLGLLAFLVALALLGVARDYAYSIATGLIAFGPGPVPLVADLVAYASVAAIVQAVMYLVVGPPGADTR